MKPTKARTAVLAAFAAFAAMLTLASTATLAKVHATKEFERGETRPVTIALLPAHVELTKQRMIRREAEVEESGELEGHLAAAVAAELTARGYRVKNLTADVINADPALQELVIDADRRYGELLTNISVKLAKQVDSRRYNAGDEMKLLASKLGVDAIAFVRMQVIAAAKGVQVLNMGMGGTQTMMSVSLIDGHTADIEAYITLPIMQRGKAFGGYEDMMKNPDEEMARYAKITLEDLANADPSARVARSDDDVLEDLESLLAE